MKREDIRWKTYTSSRGFAFLMEQMEDPTHAKLIIYAIKHATEMGTSKAKRLIISPAAGTSPGHINT